MPQAVMAAVAAFQTAAIGAATTATLTITGSGAAAIVASNFVAGMVTLGAASAGVAGALGTAAGFTAISSALSPKPQVNATTSQLQTKVGAVTPRAIIMGRTAVAGTLLTPTPLKSGKDDRFASNFYALSHAGPSGVVESIQWGDDTVTFDGNGNAIGKYNDNMWLFQKNGDWNQTAISYAGHPVLGSSTPSAWDSTKRARGCLVVALVVRYAAKVLGGNMQTPLFVVDANAVALTDPRTGLAATTQAQRRNPAVGAYSWRLGWFQNGKRVIGMGQASSELHAAGYAYAANVADANGWTISGEASTADDRYGVEMAMLQACASIPVERNGLQSVVTSAVRSSVGTITSDDLRGQVKWRYATQQSSRPTSVQTRYRSESNRWQVVEGAEVTDAAWLTQDAGREKRVTVEYPYAAGGSAHVGHLAALDASNSREPLIFSLPCKQRARYAGFVGDAVTVSLPEIGLSSTKMTVQNRIVNPDGTVDYELLVETDAKYAFAAGKTSAAPSFTLQPGFDIFSVPQPGVSEWASVAAQITSGATSLPIVRVTGSAADYSFASGVVFKIRLNSGGSPWLVSEDAPPAATQHEFRGLTNATSYIVGVAYRGVTGVEGPVRELAAVTTGTLVAAEAGAGPGGAPILNSLVPSDGNLFRYSLMERGTRGYQSFAFSGATITVPPALLAFSGIRLVKTDFTSSTNGSSTFLGTNAQGLARVKPSQRYSIQARTQTDGAIQSSQLAIDWRNDDNSASLGFSFSDTVTGTSPLGTLRQFFATAPANAAFANVYLISTNTNGGAGFLVLYEGQITAVTATTTVHPAFTQGPFGDDGADVTGSNTAAAIVGQGTGATASNLTGLNPTEGGKLSGIEVGADVTAGKTAAAIAGQGNNATKNTNAGLLSARPTGVDGDTYHATDTKEIYFKTGGSWIKVADVANTFTVSLSATNITASGTGTTLTTGNVTATPSGGSGSYGYAWAVVTKDVQSLNPFMTSQSATSACRVTLGAGQAVEGTIQLTVTDLSTGAIQIKTLTYNITNTA